MISIRSGGRRARDDPQEQDESGGKGGGHSNHPGIDATLYEADF